MHCPVIIQYITAVLAIHFPQGHFHLSCPLGSSLPEALPVLANYLEGFTSLFSKLPSLCDPNNLETPWSHPEILDTKYISKVVSYLKIPDFIKQILKSLKKKSLL